MSIFRIETDFEITGMRLGSSKGGRTVVLSGHVIDPVDPRRADAVVFKELEIHIHTNDGQSPYRLGHKLKIIITD